MTATRTPMTRVPELLAPAGSLDAARAALANGADAVYLGVGRFNARDDGAQLTLEELEVACRLAHGRGARVYLTLNTLIKPAEVGDALRLLGDCVDAGIDAVLVQDLGLVTLIRQLCPMLAIHGSTQMSVHDAAGARVVRALGAERVVLARENTLADVAAIRAEAAGVGVETFVHGALCISYSGQCFMSGMISERSANRGSCAQSCRKDYLLHDSSGQELDRGYLISAKDLGAYDHLAALAELGVDCLKVEGRKKKPEYVATVTRQYREFLARLQRGDFAPPDDQDTQPLVQIYSRGFTGGMFGGRAGREYVTRTHPDNHGLELGRVTRASGGTIEVVVRHPVVVGDGVGFEPPAGEVAKSVGFTVRSVETLGAVTEGVRQAIASDVAVPVGWTVRRTSDPALLAEARASVRGDDPPPPRRQLDVRAFGSAGAPLKLVFATAVDEETVTSAAPLAPATRHALDETTLREHLGKLGETPYALGRLDMRGLAPGLFLPVSELNHLRRQAVEAIEERRGWTEDARRTEREQRIASLAALPRAAVVANVPPRLIVEVCRVEDADSAVEAGATEIVVDPFLRHPTPPRTRVRKLAESFAARGVTVRLRTPTVVRPDDRSRLEPWLALGLPILTGHLGLLADLAAEGRDVVADYAVNCFNPHTARVLWELGARRITPSVELTADEVASVIAPWGGAGFDVLIFGRPEGMTIEHCVLSAAFDREPTTCRDLCVKSHPDVRLTDPVGYVFPVATDSDCRNRLLHSRPISGAEYMASLWNAGVRGWRLVFNTPGDAVAPVVAAYRGMVEALAAGDAPALDAVRAAVGPEYTRGHFARAV